MSNLVQTAPSTRGRVLSRMVTVTVHDGIKEIDYAEKRLFITSAKVTFQPSDEQLSANIGPYVGVWVDTPDFQRTYLMFPGDLRHIASRLKVGRYYGFEGTARYGRRDNRLTRFMTVTGITNQTITVFEKPTEQDAVAAEETEEPMFVG